jgi:hypothetical protein
MAKPQPHSLLLLEPLLEQNPEALVPAATAISPLASSITAASSTIRGNPEELVKTLPLDYTKCEVRQLGSVISDMLCELIQYNDQLGLRNNEITPFHSRFPNPLHLNRTKF